MKALCSVWEARWREERTLREEAEAALRNLRKIDGKVANDSKERSGDRLIALRGTPLSLLFLSHVKRS